jgi:hypothetical protein
MSERRQRQQQRRQRRKARGRVRAGGARQRSPQREAAAALDRLLSKMATLAVRDVPALEDALDAETWASGLIGTWYAGARPGDDVQAVFFPGLVDALEQRGSAPALATLLAFAAVGAPTHARAARAAAGRLAGRGIAEPSWAGALGRARPTAAVLMREETFDDGMSVMVEFAGAGDEPHTLGVYIDHNLGGLVKDAFLAGPLLEVRRTFNRRAPNGVGLQLRELDLAEARARVEAALDMLDHTFDPPVDEDVRSLRVLIDARMRLLPEGFELPYDDREFTPEARDALLADFLGSPEGRRWRDDEHAEDLAGLAVDFGADYNHGGPLRWSPVVVELFMTSWLARKVARDPDFFARVPEVLRDWVRYAGRRNGVPATPLREAVAAVDEFRDEMFDAVTDPRAWGPAKAFAVAALDAGIDLDDPDQVERFVHRYNDGFAA